MDYPGIDGFLGTRASLMLDVVFVAMLLVIPTMFASIWLVRYRKAYTLHKRIQLTLAGLLVCAVALFEADMQIHGWQARAAGTAGGEPSSTVYQALYVHLVFAVSSPVLWLFTIVQALRKMPDPPGPCAYSPRHIFWGWLAAIDMTLTAITGWTFYYLAFVR